MKKILILTAGFGEGHNSAARGIRDALAEIAGERVAVEVHDLFREFYGVLNDLVRDAYLGVIDHAPHVWARIYRWMDAKENFHGNFNFFFPVRLKLRRLLARWQPDVVVSVYPAYPHLLDDIFGETPTPFRRVVTVTDSITINAIWYRCHADYFILPNDLTAKVLRGAAIPEEKIRAFGFPVSPTFARGTERRSAPVRGNRRVLFLVNGATPEAPGLARRLAAVPEIALTVAVGRDAKLRRAVEAACADATGPVEVIGWSDEIPRLLRRTHLLISKAGGATVQEAIAASCPLVINRIVPGQEEGNARLICETNSGRIALTNEEVARAVAQAFADDGSLWRTWAENIGQLTRPRAALDTAEFLLSL